VDILFYTLNMSKEFVIVERKEIKIYNKKRRIKNDKSSN